MHESQGQAPQKLKVELSLWMVVVIILVVVAISWFGRGWWDKPVGSGTGGTPTNTMSGATNSLTTTTPTNPVVVFTNLVPTGPADEYQRTSGGDEKEVQTSVFVTNSKGAIVGVETTTTKSSNSWARGYGPQPPVVIITGSGTNQPPVAMMITQVVNSSTGGSGGHTPHDQWWSTPNSPPTAKERVKNSWLKPAFSL